MAFTPTKNLLSDPTVNLRDQQHAARIFADDQFRLAPKHNFLFHVAFGINPAALSNTTLIQRYGQEINLLVKSVDLPHYQVQTETLNQYNRKKVVQYQHKTQELGIKFHDDNMGLINQLWQNYYSYYYADSTSAKTNGAYNRNATRKFDFILTQYGLDNGSTAPFFNYIKIYQMARHEYVMYQLWNPIISSWNHNKLAYSDHNVHDFDMRIVYEAVSYDVGVVSEDHPEGFGLTHYDHNESPLHGINPSPTSVNPSFVPSSVVNSIAPSLLNAAIVQVTTAQNNNSVSSGQATGLFSNTTNQAGGTVVGAGGATGGGSASGSSSLLTTKTVQIGGGVPGVVFPIAVSNTNTSTVAAVTKLGS